MSNKTMRINPTATIGTGTIPSSAVKRTNIRNPNMPSFTEPLLTKDDLVTIARLVVRQFDRYSELPVELVIEDRVLFSMDALQNHLKVHVTLHGALLDVDRDVTTDRHIRNHLNLVKSIGMAGTAYKGSNLERSNQLRVVYYYSTDFTYEYSISYHDLGLEFCGACNWIRLRD